LSEIGEAARLLVGLVRTPSPSGSEEPVARELEAWAREAGLACVRDDAALRLEVEGRAPGPTLALASHLDTVPVGEGWSVDPFAGTIRDGVLIGRGAVDAKASVAAMAIAAARIAKAGGPARGRLVVLATYGEETRATSMPRALERLGGLPDAAVVGEPTRLEPCTAQRGLMVVTLRWRGEQLHAGWAADLPKRPTNAIEAAAPDLARLAALPFERVHPQLGRVAVTPTQMHAGVGRNVTPPVAEALLDVRTTPAYTHEEIAAILRESFSGEVEIVSDRLRPAQTPDDSALLRSILAVEPKARPFASPTSSDWVFLRETDAVKLGPGDSTLSHRPDERIELVEVDEAAALYAAIAEEYLR
jgi:acetylornithine deacetylase